MKNIQIDWLKDTKQTVEIHTRRGSFGRYTALAGAALTSLLLAAQPAHAGSIFYILMENHNLTQPTNVTSPQQILGNAAAPYLNSLLTPGNPNAAQASWATKYFNAGNNVHPSEPNYVWAEAGSDFGFHSDADPSPANGNTFYDLSNHLSKQFTTEGITWKNYQEDVDLSASPTNSASGTNGPINAYNGTRQFNYAVKHNPEAFFADSATANVFPLTQLSADLSANTVGEFNYITPDQFNDAHSALNGGFIYNGTHFTGDQASIAQGDNFLSQVIPQIMASKAYQNNGVIVIWWDETEGGDTSGFALPEIVISKLAKGNGFASSVQMNHSSDIKTWEEVFGFSFLNNPIPVGETNVNGGFNNVATVNDLSDLFKPRVIPQVPQVSIIPGEQLHLPFSTNVFQIVFIQNNGESSIPNPMFLELNNLSSNATLVNATGTSSVIAPLGSPYIQVFAGDDDADDVLRPHEFRLVVLEFSDSNKGPITYTPRLLPVTPAP